MNLTGWIFKAQWSTIFKPHYSSLGSRWGYRANKGHWFTQVCCDRGRCYSHRQGNFNIQCDCCLFTASNIRDYTSVPTMVKKGGWINDKASIFDFNFISWLNWIINSIGIFLEPTGENKRKRKKINFWLFQINHYLSVFQHHDIFILLSN